uniref:RPA1 related single stranded DNA binding protein, X-linked n=1 Tax=Leptobrachium leishanense TaxID=445787 RepID=A0A8C5WBB4_9ANUR
MQEQLAEFEARSPGSALTRSPGLSAQTGRSWIRLAREQLRVSPSLRLLLREPQPVLVLAVERYLGEGARPAAATYYYDVTLWDGTERDIWHLSPELGHLVQRNALRCGLRVSISCCSYRFLDKRLAAGLVCIDGLQLGEDAFPEAPGGQLGRGGQEPLRGSKKHYLPLWNNQDPYGEIWKQSREAEEALSVSVSRICSLQHLENIWRSKTTLPPLLVRIMYKSRLRYFGKPDRKTDIPYQAYFEVADHSGMMSLVLWNSLCPEWFNTLEIGKVILLQKYAVKNSYPNRTLPTPADSQVKRLPSLEISLNARDPPCSINVIKENLVRPEWRLPAVKYHFVTRAELRDLPHNRVCDVIGLVTFVGRCERKRVADDSEDFWLYRWIQVIDGTTDEPFLLEIFATSQPDIFENIHPMSYLVCTQMRVLREDPLEPTGSVHLTTTNESQVFISGHHKGQPYVSDQKVKNFIEWMKNQTEAEMKKKVTIGGYFPLPPTPATFLKYCNENKVESVLTSFDELKKVIEHLHYREHKRIALQGMIVALKFAEYDSVARNALEKEAHPASVDGKKPVANDLSTLLLQHAAEEHVLQPKEMDTDSSKRRKRPHELSDDDLESEEPDFEHRALEPDLSDVASQDTAEEGSEISKSSELLWESNLWSEVGTSLTDHLRHNRVFPESIPRKFDYLHKDVLIHHYNLHPARLSTVMCQSKKRLQEFTPANSIGHCELTILSLNQNLAIDVVALPLFCSDHSYMFTINPTSNNVNFPCPGVSAERRSEGTTQTLFSSEGDWVKFVRAHDGIHVVCILDLCHLGEDNVEVCLNKIYNPANEAGDIA